MSNVKCCIASVSNGSGFCLDVRRSKTDPDSLGILNRVARHSRSSAEIMELDSLTVSARFLVRSERWRIDRPYFGIRGFGIRFGDNKYRVYGRGKVQIPSS